MGYSCPTPYSVRIFHSLHHSQQSNFPPKLQGRMFSPHGDYDSKKSLTPPKVDPALSLPKTQAPAWTLSQDLGYQKHSPLKSQVKLDKEQGERGNMIADMREDNTNAIHGWYHFKDGSDYYEMNKKYQTAYSNFDKYRKDLESYGYLWTQPI